jgi:hypothetical protein
MRLRGLSLGKPVVAAIGIILTCASNAQSRLGADFADVHIHYNWDQREVISAQAVVEKIRNAGVEFAVVASTPSQLALELKRAGGDLIIPFFSPYTHELGKRDWHISEQTVALAETGLRNGQYLGIGEVHFMAGFRPRTDNGIFLRLLELAREYAVPVLIHVDSGNENMFVDICRRHPALKLVLAHAGGNLQARHIRRVIEQCDNAMVEFSARDPWRYGGLTGKETRLLPEWRELVLEHPERFMTGTDPVWKVTRTQTWDQADDGWDHFDRLIAYHRQWLEQLPQAVRRKVQIDNARRFFGR